MNKVSLLLAVALQLSVSSHAKIWRVNNVAGITADFITVQAAHDGAAAGDTLHLEPSITSYGNLTMSKRLSIVSSGQFASDNPGYQQDIKNAYAGEVAIADAGANGSLLSIRCLQIRIDGSAVANISLLNCAVTTASDGQCFGGLGDQGGLNIIGADNIIVSGCWFAYVSLRSASNNILLTNNIIAGRVAVDGGSSGVFRNNVICALFQGNTCGSPPTLANSSFINNIFNKGFFLGAGVISNCSFQNNFSADAFLPAGNGNVNNMNMTTVFVNTSGGYVDNAYLLKQGSPAIGAGVNGENLGAFGGTTPFRIAVTPSIPSIYKLAVPSAASGASMNIIFSTRTNN
ncbi:MAG: hypothetical protein V4717_11940 [Bacteroidota bacterium]